LLHSGQIFYFHIFTFSDERLVSLEAPTKVSVRKKQSPVKNKRALRRDESMKKLHRKKNVDLSGAKEASRGNGKSVESTQVRPEKSFNKESVPKKNGSQLVKKKSKLLDIIFPSLQKTKIGVNMGRAARILLQVSDLDGP
jgi:hypothetical protein